MLVQVSSANTSMLLPSTTIIIFFFFQFHKIELPYLSRLCLWIILEDNFYCDFVVISDIKLKC